MKTLFYILDCSSSPLCCFPVSLSFATQSAVAVVSSAVSSGGVECVALLAWGFRLWWTWMKRGYALCNSQSANIVLPLAGIHNTFLARFRVSMAAAVFAFASVFFFLAAVKCQHYLCDWHKDISFKSSKCSEPSSAAHPVIVEYFVCVRGTHFSCIGSYSPPLMYLTMQVFCWVKLSICLQ